MRVAVRPMPKRHRTVAAPSYGGPLRSLATLCCAVLALSVSAQPLQAETSGLAATDVLAPLRFAGRERQPVRITVQRVDVRTGKPARGAGPLYLTSDYARIDFPAAPALDAKGRATLRLLMHPPSPGSPCRGQITVWVILDEEDADDTMGARVVIPYTADTQATGCLAASADPGSR